MDILEPLGAQTARDLRCQDRGLAFPTVCHESWLDLAMPLQVIGEGDGVPRWLASSLIRWLAFEDLRERGKALPGRHRVETETTPRFG